MLDAGRAAVAALTGFAAGDVVFTTGSNHALDILLGDWRGARTVACLPGEYGPNLFAMARHGFDVRLLPVDASGRLDVEAAALALASEPPALVHFTPLASHRGIVQPVAAVAAMCRDAGIPLIVDAAQAFAHLDCARVGADAVYSLVAEVDGGASRRRHARRPRRAAERGGARPTRRTPKPTSLRRWVFRSRSASTWLPDPSSVRARLVEVGAMTRTAVAGVAGWRVVEPTDEPSATTTLIPPDGVDPLAVRTRLIAEHRIVTTYAGVRAGAARDDRPGAAVVAARRRHR